MGVIGIGIDRGRKLTLTQETQRDLNLALILIGCSTYEPVTVLVLAGHHYVLTYLACQRDALLPGLLLSAQELQQ